MIMKAITTTPRSGKWGVSFYIPEGSEGPQDWTAPAFFLPCYSYEHAMAVTNAFNAQGKDTRRPLHELLEEEGNRLQDK